MVSGQKVGQRGTPFAQNRVPAVRNEVQVELSGELNGELNDLLVASIFVNDVALAIERNEALQVYTRAPPRVSRNELIAESAHGAQGAHS